LDPSPPRGPSPSTYRNMVTKESSCGLLLSPIELLVSCGLMVFPRSFLERRVRAMLLEGCFRGCTKVSFYKSGRSALRAVFARIAQQEGESGVLLPDYVCNLISRAAVDAGLSVSTYRTDEAFQPDIEELERRLRELRPAAVVLASLFGSQAHREETVKRIRAISTQVIVIADECQNVTTEGTPDPDERTVVVFSFNGKNVPGVMGGGMCWRSDQLSIAPAPKRFWSDLRLELHVAWLVLRQIGDRIRRSLRALCGRAHGTRTWPPREHSECRRLHFDTEVQPIAKLSLIRAWFGLARLGRLEARRRRNYRRFREALQEGGRGRLITTERGDVAPFIPFTCADAELPGQMPLKGAYAIDGDPDRSLRPKLLLLRNDGLSRLDFSFKA